MRIESGTQKNDSNIQSWNQNSKDSIYESFKKLSQDHLGLIDLKPEEFKKLTKEIYESLLKEFENDSVMSFAGKEVNKLYDYFLQKDEELIVRREIPDKVFSLLHEKKALTVQSGEIGFSEYPNCALFGGVSHDMQGLKNAFSEGWGESGGVVVTIAFHKNEEKMTVIELAGEAQINQSERRDKVRSFTGEISPEDLAFVVLRIPNSLNIASKPDEGFYSFKAFVFNENKETLDQYFNINKKEASQYRKAS